MKVKICMTVFDNLKSSEQNNDSKNESSECDNIELKNVDVKKLIIKLKHSKFYNFYSCK